MVTAAQPVVAASAASTAKCWLPMLLLLVAQFGCGAVLAKTAATTKPAAAGAVTPQQIRLTTLDWAPYTGARLPGGGEVTQLLSTVLAELGYQLHVDFLPWPTAVAQVKSGVNGQRGYYPEYQLNDPTLLISGAIGYSELGLVETIEQPLLLTSFLQLQPYRFGVVQDYLNASDLDQLIAAKKLQPVVNLSDRDNVLQVARGELAAAVIDKRVLQYLLRHDPEVKNVAAGRVQFSQSLREHKSLHLVMPDNPANKRLIQQINQQLQRHKIRFLATAAPARSD